MNLLEHICDSKVYPWNQPFATDADRVAMLFEKYQEVTL